MNGARLLISGFSVVSFAWTNVPNAASVGKEALRQVVRSPAEILEALKGGDWNAIDTVTGQIGRHLQNEQIKTALIAALHKETEFQRAQGATVGEGRGEYYMNLLDVTCQLTDDPRIISVLIDSLEVVGGNRVPRALAAFGEAALEPLIDKYEHASDRARSSILHAVTVFVDSNNLASSCQRRLTGLLLEGLEDISPIARMNAIDGLVACKYSEAVPVLEDLATNDSYSRLTNIDGEKVEIYPVRVKARNAVEVLSARK